MKVCATVAVVLGVLGVGAVVGFFIFQHFNSTSPLLMSTSASQNVTQPQEELQSQNQTQSQTDSESQSESPLEPKLQ